MAAKTSSQEKGSSAAKHAFEFCAGKIEGSYPVAVGCFGSDDFLRRMAIKKLISSSGLDEETIRVYDGEEASWRDVHDELATRSLFDTDGLKIAIVRSADKFITKNREALERWVQKAQPDATLILEIQTLPANTTLYKLISKNGWLVNCTPPRKASYGSPTDEKAMQKWIEQWALSKHSVKLTARQTALIVERVGDVCGLIDCEIAKLALFADEQGHVSDERLTEMVGGWRTQTTWDISDAIADGKTGWALEQLDKLFTAGQNAIGLFAQLSWSLRRFGLAAHLIEQSERNNQRLSIQTALEMAGFNKFDLAKNETRLKRIGRQRARMLLTWLVDLELKLKGSHSGEDRARLALESLILRLG